MRICVVVLHCFRQKKLNSIPSFEMHASYICMFKLDESMSFCISSFRCGFFVST